MCQGGPVTLRVRYVQRFSPVALPLPNAHQPLAYAAHLFIEGMLASSTPANMEYNRCSQRATRR
jgi:hypothetical protein